MKIWDFFDPSNPELRDVDDEVGQSWLLQTSRFKPYDQAAPDTPPSPPDVVAVPLSDAPVEAATAP